MPSVNRFEAYKAALEAARHDTTNLWQTFSVFLLAETFLLGFALNSFGGSFAPGSRPAAFLGSLAALILCLPWFATYERATTMRNLRIHQARALEEDPSRTLRDGLKLVEGQAVTAAHRSFRLNPVLQSNGFWLRFLILALFLADDLIAAVAAPF